MEIQPRENFGALISVIERCATNKDVDVEKMSKLLDMQERILNRQAYQDYCVAFAKMQAELPEIERNGAIKIDGNVRSRHALAEDINEAVKPILKEYGFALFHRTKQIPGFVTTTTILMHEGGHTEETEITFPNDMSGSKNSLQAVGSSSSYGKRYNTCAILNITSRGIDDDASSADPMASEAQKKIINGLLSKLSDAQKESFNNATGGVDKVKRKNVDSVIARIKNYIDMNSSQDL